MKGLEWDGAKKKANLGAYIDVVEGEDGENMEMNRATMTEETGRSLALTSPRLLPRRACIPVAPRRRTVDNNPEPPSYAAWPKGVAEDRRTVNPIMGIPIIINHCYADLTTMLITMMIWTTVVHPVGRETELGDYVHKEIYDAGQSILTFNNGECPRDQRQGDPPAEAEVTASMKVETTTGRCIGRSLALTSPRPVRLRCA